MCNKSLFLRLVSKAKILCISSFVIACIGKISLFILSSTAKLVPVHRQQENLSVQDKTLYTPRSWKLSQFCYESYILGTITACQI